MAGKGAERVYRMTLAEFHRYLDDKRRELETCYKEIEEVQFQFNDIFKRELEAWKEKFAFCYPRVAARRRELPPAFAQLIDRAEAEERARLQAEIASLEKEIRESRAKMDELLAQAKATTGDLRRANPQFDQREEALKALIAKLEDQYAEAFEELEKLDTFPLGWLIHARRISKLKRAQRQAKEEQAKALMQLRQVRQEWLDTVQKAGEKQAELRQQWEQLGVRVAEAESRRAYLQTNLEALAEQGALQKVLENLNEPPDIPGELGEALRDLAQRNQVRRAYEEGLRAVAEILGLTKGVGEGLKRFQQSVATVLQEQRRYNLKEVQVPVSQWAVTLNETWKELQAKVKDEKQMGRHPLEFSQIVSQYVKGRLTDANIQGLFEHLGKALSQATAAWG